MTRLGLFAVSMSLVACSAAPADPTPASTDQQNLDLPGFVCDLGSNIGVIPKGSPSTCTAGQACEPERFEQVSPSLFRGGHPKTNEMMQYLRDRNIATAVSLEMPATTLQGWAEQSCMHDGIPDEAKRAATYSIAFHARGFEPTKEVVDLQDTTGGVQNGCTDAASMADATSACHALIDASIEQTLDILGSATADAPAYVHCTLGVDRTGMIVALYRVKFQGWSAKDAAQEWMDHGFGSGGFLGKATRCQNFAMLDYAFNRWVKKINPAETFQLDPNVPGCGL